MPRINILSTANRLSDQSISAHRARRCRRCLSFLKIPRYPGVKHALVHSLVRSPDAGIAEMHEAVLESQRAVPAPEIIHPGANLLVELKIGSQIRTSDVRV